MPYNLESPRYIPLTHHGLDGAVLLLDSQAPLKDLHACVELRVRLATEFLDAVSSKKPGSADDYDLNAMAGTAHLLMQEACDMNRVIERRLWEGI
ncbi:hypothetical protein AFK24_15010 [Pseudomonas syringae]|uniref:DUF3077 domain-containing protein n=1 Tax=Pseudomonas syringae TaxID=317 RepID=A0A1C7Z5B9_PSESX|nr:hypothetical protein [Pseudomonas syringae]OCR24236.1 hypothetical protein AFK24_15010 [Pseudomonas syringae]